MTTTIDTDGRATGDTTHTKVTDLKPGDVIEASWDELAEVRLVEPIPGTGNALLLFVGGRTEIGPADQRYSVVDPERAEKWRAYQRDMLRRIRFADQLDDLARQIRNGHLPMPREFLTSHLSVDVASQSEVEQAAETLGVEVERDDRTTCAWWYGARGDLTVRFQHYQRVEADADA